MPIEMYECTCLYGVNEELVILGNSLWVSHRVGTSTGSRTPRAKIHSIFTHTCVCGENENLIFLTFLFGDERDK